MTSSAGAALVISVVAHAVAAVTIGAVFRASTKSTASHQDSISIESVEPVEVDVDLASNLAVDRPASSARQPEPAPRARSVSVLRRSTPRAAGILNDAALDSPAATADVAVPVPRFMMAGGTVTARGPAAPAPAPGAQPGVAHGADVLAEGDVDAPARVLSTSPLVYPPAAQTAEIELDLPLEIVVDTDGRVSAARSLTRAGYGLDEAALRAIRLYRFSPALRAGRPVPVRMRWTVQFRLR